MVATYENRYITMGARLYDPDLGQFLSVDPLADIFAFTSPYVYANNSPLKHINSVKDMLHTDLEVTEFGKRSADKTCKFLIEYNISDPSGLAPEKDYGEKFMDALNMSGSELNVNNFAKSLGEHMAEHVANMGWQEGFFLWAEYMGDPWRGFEVQTCGIGGAGGRSGDKTKSKRTGDESSEQKGPKYEYSLKINKNDVEQSIVDMNDKVREEMENDKEEGNPREWGYFIRESDGELWADFFSGGGRDYWMTLSDEDPYEGTDVKGNGDIIWGFVHGHYDPEYFSTNYQLAISNFSLGLYEWTGLPKMASFDTYVEAGRYYISNITIYNNNPAYLSNQFYGLVYPNGSLMFKWKATTQSGLTGMYNNIWLFGNGLELFDFEDNAKKYGIIYWRLKK